MGMLQATPMWAQCNADAGDNSSQCAGATITLGGSPAATGNGPFTYAWSPATGLSATNVANPVLTVPGSTQTYTLTITDSDGCVSTDQVTITVLPTPTATLVSTGPAQVSTFGGLTTFSICDQFPNWVFDFQDQSAPYPGSTRTLTWGDGSPVENPAQGWALSHTYVQGLHTMSYTVSYPNGCSHTTQYQVFLGTNPGGGISIPPGSNICSGDALPFILNSTEDNTAGTTYSIDFGDGQQITMGHPPPGTVWHDYDLTSCGYPGNQFYAYFIAQNPCDFTDGQVGPIRVSETALAQFTLSPNDTVCVNTTVTLTDQSLGLQAPQCQAPRRIWSISPGAGWTIVSGTLGNVNGNPGNPGLWTSGSATLGLQFNTPGTYTVQDLTGNSCGLDSLQRTICVEAPPVVDFTASPIGTCVPAVVNTVNNSVSPNSCLTTRVWNAVFNGGECSTDGAWSFTGGTNSGSLQPQFTFTEPGSYTMRLELTNSCGTFIDTETITIAAPPQVSLSSLAGICAGDCVNPVASTVACGSPISAFNWTFPSGDPASADGPVPGAVCYNNSGSFNVGLSVTNGCGTTTATTPLVVSPVPPAPVITSNSPVCMGQTISLAVEPIPGATFQWSGPNGFSSNQTSVVITQAGAANQGTYSVVAMSGGCPGPSASVFVEVIAAPVLTVSASPPAMCVGNTSTLAVQGADNYEWYIGNQLIGTGQSIDVTPSSTTPYTVTGSLGDCPGTATIAVVVHQLPVVNAGPDQVLCDQAIAVQLNGLPQPGTWSGPIVTPEGSFTPIPGTWDDYTLAYTHTDANGCTATDTVQVTVEALTLVAALGPDTTVCQGFVPVQLSATPPGGTWSGASPTGLFTPSDVGDQTVTYTYGTGTCQTSDAMTVTVVGSAALTLPPAFSRCADAAPVDLVALPAGGTWSGAGVSGPPWSFDPGSVPPDTHLLTYTYSDGIGCQSVGVVQATVNALPVVDAGSDLVLCDQPFAVPLGGSPAGGSWSATWMNVPPDGEFTPDGPGDDVFTYTFTDGNGCTASDAITVNVVTIDDPAFAGPDTAVCVGSMPWQFTGAPAGGTWSGTWVDDDGTFQPEEAGDFTLTYAVGTGTCLTMDQLVVTVHPLPVVSTGGNIAVCLDAGPQQLTADPPGGTWSGDGVDPITGVFDPLQAPDPATPVSYSYTDPITGCTATASALVTVNPLPVAAFTHDPIACVGAAFTFTDQSTGAGVLNWDFGDGGTGQGPAPQHVYSTSGTYTVMLVAGTGAGCSDTTYSSVDVWDAPVADLALGNAQGCGPLEVTFTNGSTGPGLGYQWQFGGLGTSDEATPPAFNFPADAMDVATYSVTLTATNFCGSDMAQGTVTVLPSPTAAFGTNLNAYCAFDTVWMANNSIGLPDGYWWDFGDGATSTDPGPVVGHAYATGEDPVDFMITMVAYNGCGSDTATQQITVLPNEVVAFFNTSVTNGCAPLTVQFTSFSVGDTAWVWQFGDGNVSNAVAPEHTFTQPGTYTVTLDAFGCGYDQATVQIEVYPSPLPVFTFEPAPVCANEPIQFTDLTPEVASRTWDFGDGNGSQLQAPVHSYASGGSWPVTLSVTSILNGCSGTATQTVTVSTTPVAAFSVDPAVGCMPLLVAFTSQSINSDFAQWSFGDGNTSGLTDPFHTYAQPGTYNVTLVAEHMSGCTDTASSTVVVHPLPIAAFTLEPEQSCYSPVAVQAINASQGAVSYAWDLGNGSSSALNQPSVVFNDPSTYTVQLVAFNQYGCTDTATVDFTVHPTPVASFTVEPSPACATYPVYFFSTSQYATSMLWDLGNGQSSTLDAPVTIYPQTGSYDVQLIVFGAGGCSDTLLVPAAITIHPTPIADFTADTLLSMDNALRFTNLSQGAQQYQWDFGDGSGSTDVHPVHAWSGDADRFFEVCLVAINNFGCPDTLCTPLWITSDPAVYVPNGFTPNGDGLNETLLPVLNGFDAPIWNYRYMVFDRWGLMLHETTDRAHGWNGVYGGQDCPVDVYVWRVVVERWNAGEREVRQFTGHATLVR